MKKVKGKKNALAKMLLKYRTDNNLRCEDMARKAGMTKQQYNTYEQDINRLPSLYNIKKLSKVMNIEEKEMYKILIEDNKTDIQGRFSMLLRYRDISGDDLLTIAMILLQYL